ncbi:endoplasmic reticulum transmembrane helix translocase-like [Oppia nitens]|uniref:endoplasmic reticulum transmembrane helix translocase-like n=1 Tax=Oppia nitens TaxID=1686743 RepID=UPI0023DA2CC6|nr:endoplasmic reticulum transmembrane helix translocase-like [Oppia nitens]
MEAISESSDQLVKSVDCYTSRPLILHGYIGPFVSIYVILIYNWLSYYSQQDSSQEIWFIAVALVVVVQILAYLFSHWSVHCKSFFAFTKTSGPGSATFVKVVPTPNNGSPEMVRLHHTAITDTGGDNKDGGEEIWFTFQKTKYVYDFESKRFHVLSFPINLEITAYQNWKGYQDDQELAGIERRFGRNNLDMEVPEFIELFRERATAPFFVFQLFCVGLWCLDEFWYYSVFTLVMLVAFECVLVQQQLRNLSEIRKMGTKPYSIQVYRNRKWRAIQTNELVAGDIVSIVRSQDENLVPCDLLLIRGSCIVDESMLTGESVPQMKEPIESITENRNFDIDSDGRLHMLYGGTKVLQHTAPVKLATGLRAGDNGCVGYVLRTGFNTSQGKLLRTILYGVKRVTANNLETFAFILFLLIFAIAAATYVWIKGTEDPKRNRYKLFLECTLILTSVVPPELPIELSLAVNTSLLSLSKLFIYCTEPFRIPFGGKVDVCCFDKTGTLTSNDLVVEGVAGIKDKEKVCPLSDVPLDTIQILATCHALVQLEDGLVGDPLEKSTLNAIEWMLTKADAVIPKKGKSPGLKIFHRFHFSSALKRMSVIASYSAPNSSDIIYFSAVKGAPEILKPMFSKVPDNYDDVYIEMSRRGTRVLALGRKTLGMLSHQQVRDMNRNDIEKNLEFGGFLVISCPLKPDSKSVMKEIISSQHHTVMITGDAPLTACHVAKELHFVSKKKETLILTPIDNQNDYQWISINEKTKLDCIPKDLKQFFNSYELCITGDALNYLIGKDLKFFKKLLPHIRVFARVAPKQKEIIITSLRSLGFNTLMTGDGTNDVGALKHAHVGVALLANAPLQASDIPKPKKATSSSTTNDSSEMSNNIPRNRMRGRPHSERNSGTGSSTRPQNRAADTQQQLQRMIQEMEEQDKATVVKLGDASIAAPFTSKLSSIQCVCHIIKQGRCTLVTTLQMFKILALNALILAYSQSVLYLDGIKFSDGQATLQGLLLAGCFLFISRSRPLTTLSSRRPLPNIFNIYTILTVLLQFAVHFCTLIYLVNEAKVRSPKADEKFADLDAEFKASIINSTVYIISISLQVSTFAVNYKGHPFMESLTENKPLLYSIIGSFVAVICLVTGLLPDLSNQFGIVEFSLDFQKVLLSVLAMDLICALAVDRILEFLFGRAKLKSL